MIQTLRRLQQILDTNAFLLTRDQVEEARKLITSAIAASERQEGEIQSLKDLVRESIGGAMFVSCFYQDHEDADPAWHCCDWSEWVEKARAAVGLPEIILPEESQHATTQPD